jgi:hypothetical protein
VDKLRKAQAAEKVIFGFLLVLLAGAGVLYELFRYDYPGWGLVGWLTVYMGACYVAYRAALKYVCRNL